MKNNLNKISNTLMPIFFIIILILTFTAFTNNSTTQDDINKLNAQIKFNNEHKLPALTVDGVKSDGTKMTEEEIQERKEIEKQIKEVDIISPVVLKNIEKTNINIPTTIFISIIFGVILILLQYGIFKTISKISGAFIFGTSLSFGFVLNLKNYISMGNISEICAMQVSFFVITLITYLISKILSNRINIHTENKANKEIDNKIKERLQKKEELEQEILNSEQNSNQPIFVVATRESSTTTNVEAKTGIDEKLIAKNKKLKKLAFEDGLTGLFNRTAFLEDMKNGKIENTGIIVFDVNNLKKTNDTFGHTEGDKLITYASKNIFSLFQTVGKCYRIGGDEFTVIIEDINDENEIKEKIDSLNPILEKNNPLTFPVIVAAGFAIFSERLDSDLNDTFNRADAAMYENKKKLKESKNNQECDEVLNISINNSVQENNSTDEENVKTEAPIAENNENLEKENNFKEDAEILNLDLSEKQQEIEEQLDNAKKELEIEKNDFLSQKETELKELEKIKEQSKIELEQHKAILEEEKNKIEEQKKNIDLEKEKIEKEKEKYFNPNTPIVERIVKKIDGTIEKVEGDETITANYESIKDYLERHEKRENSEQNIVSNDLPYANYNPEADSPFVNNTSNQKLEIKEKINLESDDVLNEDDDI